MVLMTSTQAVTLIEWILFHAQTGAILVNHAMDHALLHPLLHLYLNLHIALHLCVGIVIVVIAAVQHLLEDMNVNLKLAILVLLIREDFIILILDHLTWIFLQQIRFYGHGLKPRISIHSGTKKIN
jgi:hypothetical protein